MRRPRPASQPPSPSQPPGLIAAETLPLTPNALYTTFVITFGVKGAWKAILASYVCLRRVGML